ncbi:tetratricopeptide repeat protein [Myxococcota bacterium]|nr:tetratricopeptide repeat protein [Myxococcota bacterium]
MIRGNPWLALAAALAVMHPPGALAADEDGGEEDPGEDPGGDPPEGAGDPSGGGESGEGDPNIQRPDGEDASQWSYEGEKVEEKKTLETTKKVDLAPEPPARGIAGAWYEVTTDCPSCETVLGQTLGIEEPLVMRQFFDQLVLEPDGKTGKIVYVNEGQNRPVVLLSARDGRVIMAQYTVEQGARNSSAIYARIWDFRSLLDDHLLYGRKYQVTVSKEKAWTTWEKGYRADPAFMPEKELLTYATLSPIEGLTTEKKAFDLGDKARFELIGMNAWVRSDFSRDAYAALQKRIEAEQEAQRKRLADQQRHLESGDKKFSTKDYSGALADYKKARELGLDSTPVHFGLALTHHKLGQYSDAEREYVWVIDRDPKNIDVRYNLGLVYEKMDKLREALEQYQAVTKLDPDDDKAKEKAYDIALKLAGG